MKVTEIEIGIYVEVDVDGIIMGNIVFNDKAEIEHINIYQDFISDKEDIERLKNFIDKIYYGYKWVRT